MRFLTASIVGLAIAASAPAVSGKHVSVKCNTVSAGGSKTRTKFLPTHTCHKTTTIRPIATIKTTFTPKPRTRTKVAVTVATQVVSGTVRTNVVTSTSTSFKVVIPSSTVTVAPFVPTSTEYELLPPTTTFSTTITSYTELAPAPTLAAGGGVPRSVDDDDNNGFTPVPRGELRMNYDGYPGKNSGAAAGGDGARLARHGKQVICTPKVKVTATVTKKARATVTQTKRARRSTVTVTSTATGTVTSTKFPASVTSIVRKAATVTITANTVTFTEKPTLAAVTVTRTLDVSADPPSETTILDLYSVCDPSRQYTLDGWVQDGSTPFQEPFSTGVTSDAPLCCQSAADMQGAVTWAWVQPNPPAGFVAGTCFGLVLNGLYSPGGTAADQCVAANLGTQINIAPGNNQIGGLLQCGASTN
ncbi:hypothetical protein CF319_g7743 [Tilletia indica]|nr:hypothetical protein CF319_g7743 [Tilletia indica]